MALHEFLALADAKEVELEVKESKTFRRLSDLDDEMLSQLSFVITSPDNYSFGNRKDIKTVDDCFNRRNVDDGILFYKRIQSSSYQKHDACTEPFVLHYWLGYCGGNPTGFLLVKKKFVADDCCEQFQVIVENCDTDFIWRGQGDVPKLFIQEVKKAVYGDKYCEEEDD